MEEAYKEYTIMEPYKQYIISEWVDFSGNFRIIYRFGNEFGISFIRWNNPNDSDIAYDKMCESLNVTNYGNGGICEIALIIFYKEDFDLCYIKNRFNDAIRHLSYEELPELFDLVINLHGVDYSPDPIY